MSSKTTQAEDVKFGTLKELELQKEVEEFTGKKMNRIGGYAVFDYVSEDKKTYVELKSRRCKYTSYPTTLIPLIKVQKASLIHKRKGYKCYFMFAFLDGIYYTKFMPEMFSFVEKFKRNPRSDCVEKNDEYVMLPTEFLECWKELTPPKSDKKHFKPDFSNCVLYDA